jgi:hypothetical protein
MTTVTVTTTTTVAEVVRGRETNLVADGEARRVVSLVRVDHGPSTRGGSVVVASTLVSGL